jgi:hypothetical protein
MMKVYALYFESEDVARLVKANLNNGFLEFEDKSFFVNENKALKLKTPFGYSPLYVLRWDSIYPSENFNPKFNPDKQLNPEIIHKTMRLKILGNLLILKQPINPLMLLLIGLAFGGFLMYFLIASKIIRI